MSNSEKTKKELTRTNPQKATEASSAEQQLQLQEASLSWAGKIFFAGVAAYLAGIGLQRVAGAVKAEPPKFPFKLRGTPEQIRAVVDAILASKSFQQELKKPGATVQSVIDKMNLRNMTKERFRQITGKNWPI
jgi:hypothetical protein